MCGSGVADDGDHGGRKRAEGAKRLVLNVAGRNATARRLYERHGMVVESAWPSLPHIRPFILRMAKPL